MFDALSKCELPAGDFDVADDYHQQCFANDPAGHCGWGGTGVSSPIGVAV